MLQIIGGFSFTTDFIFISGTDSKSSRVEERLSSLSGFYSTSLECLSKICWEDKIL